MKCDHVQERLSDYIEGTLHASAHQRVVSHLATCRVCAREEREMAGLLQLLHERLSRREPVLDIWQELEPKIEAIRAEARLGIAARLRLRAHHFLNAVATGAILFTHALAYNTANGMQKYLLTDPFHLEEEAAG